MFRRRLASGGLRDVIAEWEAEHGTFSEQTLLARARRHCDEVTLEETVASAAGLLSGKTSTADVIDASIAIAAAVLSRTEHVVVLTSDRDDIALLPDELRARVKIEIV